MRISERRLERVNSLYKVGFLNSSPHNLVSCTYFIESVNHKSGEYLMAFTFKLRCNKETVKFILNQFLYVLNSLHPSTGQLQVWIAGSGVSAFGPDPG